MRERGGRKDIGEPPFPFGKCERTYRSTSSPFSFSILISRGARRGVYRGEGVRKKFRGDGEKVTPPTVLEALSAEKLG
jgi:hypothetical protein